MSSIQSIYIPRVHILDTEQRIYEIFVERSIGAVVRVDFTPLNKKQGFQENIEENAIYKSAFVHLYPTTTHTQESQLLW